MSDLSGLCGLDKVKLPEKLDAKPYSNLSDSSWTLRGERKIKKNGASLGT